MATCARQSAQHRHHSGALEYIENSQCQGLRQ
uniref:Uncharacterized protein n=1 Tax=Arundo donax TaxID=35708 RepID=A0A0A9BBQ7_ARUDO